MRLCVCMYVCVHVNNALNVLHSRTTGRGRLMIIFPKFMTRDAFECTHWWMFTLKKKIPTHKTIHAQVDYSQKGLIHREIFKISSLHPSLFFTGTQLHLLEMSVIEELGTGVKALNLSNNATVLVRTSSPDALDAMVTIVVMVFK